MSNIEMALHVEAVAKMISGAPFPSKASLTKARRVVEYLDLGLSGNWRPIETAPKGCRVWAFNGEQGVMCWSEGNTWALWIWADEVLSDVDPSPPQPTHWMPLPEPPSV